MEEEPSPAQRIIDAAEALKLNLQQASASDRALGVISAATTLEWIFDRASADYAYFARAFRRSPPPLEPPRVLVG
jgi:hypothetical protein